MRWSIAKEGLAVDRRHVPILKDTEGVRQRPVNDSRDLAGGADRQRANILLFEWKREWPPVPEQLKLLRLGAPSPIEQPASAYCGAGGQG
jgi:hypothetical protein